MTASGDSETLDSLLSQVCHLHHFRVFELLEAMGLYRGQPRVLHALWEQEGLTHRDLAERVQNTPATVTKMIQRMEKAGFIQCRPDPADQRVSRVYLTDAGRAIQAKVQAVWQQMEAESFAGLTQKERALLRRCLLQIRQNLQRAAEAEA